MYGLRREGEITKKVESKAAATGPNMALIDGLFKLCCFILQSFFVVFNLGANYCINFYLYKEKALLIVEML
jgi:hypothetical protein